jgi:hypothetical protein
VAHVGEVIGQILPVAVGVALSPLPIIAVVLMLTTPKARVNGPSFLLGWLAGLGVVGAIVLVVENSAGPDDGGAPAAWVSWLKLVLGVLLLAVAVRQFRGRPHDGADTATPAWMSAIDRFTPARSVGVGALLAGANPKNTLLAVSAAATIAQAGLGAGQQILGYAVFALVGTVGVGAPVLLYLALGERSTGMLAELKDWMGRHNAAIMSVLCLVIGVKLIGDAIGGLAG